MQLLTISYGYQLSVLYVKCHNCSLSTAEHSHGSAGASASIYMDQKKGYKTGVQLSSLLQLDNAALADCP